MAVGGTAVFVAVNPPSTASVAAVAGPLAAAGAPSPAPTVAPTPSPTSTMPATPPKALVAVSAAQVWGGRHKVRDFDAPALQRPARVAAWLRGMTFYQRSHLYKRLATEVRYGEEVEVLGTWGTLSHIQIPDQTGGRFPDGIIGWVSSVQLVPEPDGWGSATKVATVTAKWASLHRTVAGATRSLAISYATTLPVVKVRPHRVVVAVPGAAVQGYLPRGTVRVHQRGTPAIRPSGREVVAQAKRFLGLPYLWAGVTAWGFDCSGLTSAVYSELGMTLPRDAADQSLVGRGVPRGQLRPGDLLFFSHTSQRGDIHHVAIYAGRGRVLQSPYTGARVEIVKLRHSYLDREYWGASRPLTSKVS